MTAAITRAQLYGEISALFEDDPAFAKLAAGSPFVPGRGPLDSPLMVVAEAPGADEIKPEHMCPLVGPAGQLLSELFRESGIPEDALRIDNVVPWRPAANRTPYPHEIAAARPYLMARLAVTRPDTLIILGAVAWKALTAGEHGPFPDNRGKWLKMELQGTWVDPQAPPWRCDVLPLFHPSYVLHQPSGARRAEARAELLAGLQMILGSSRG